MLFCRSEKGSIQVFDLGADGQQLNKVTTVTLQSMVKDASRIAQVWPLNHFFLFAFCKKYWNGYCFLPFLPATNSLALKSFLSWHWAHQGPSTLTPQPEPCPWTSVKFGGPRTQSRTIYLTQTSFIRKTTMYFKMILECNKPREKTWVSDKSWDLSEYRQVQLRSHRGCVRLERLRVSSSRPGGRHGWRCPALLHHRGRHGVQPRGSCWEAAGPHPRPRQAATWLRTHIFSHRRKAQQGTLF